MKQKTVRLPEHIIPERYEIMLHPDLEKFTFRGEETVYLKLQKPTKEIILHTDELEIDKVKYVNGKFEIEPKKIVLNKKTETVIFSFPETISSGKGELFIKFKGILNDKMRGFYRSKYVLNGENRYLATSQFESTDARRAFPCIDEPAAKAIFDVTLMIPQKMTAISNTLPSEVLEHEAGYQVVKFAPTPKMSTYLLAFLVGDFEYIERKTTTVIPLKRGIHKKNDINIDSRFRGNDKGVLVRVFTTPGKKDQAKFALDVAVKCLEFYEDYFKIQYPLPVLDMIAIPDFAAGAMENWGAVTYRESTLLIEEEKSSVANKQWVALVIAHELAHQWFGNLVTMEWWTHLWLNEGFASFIEFLAIDHLFPEWDIWTQFVDSEMASALSLDALANTHPIEVEVAHPAEISEIFDRVSYEKGASILRMLWKYLGEKDFQKGLQKYLKRHSFGNAQTEDLWRALEEVSGKPVGRVMVNWTSKAGHPVIKVREVGGGERLELTQSRFFSNPVSKRKSKDKTIWSIPLDGQLMDKKTRSHIGSGKLNKDEVSFVRVDYPAQYLDKLEDQIRAGKLSAPDRLGLIRDSFALSESGDSPTTLALELAQNYKKEKDFTVWSELTSNLSKLESLLAYEDFFEDFKKYGREIYLEIAKDLGWEKKKGEKHTDALLRGMVLYKLGSYGDKETIKKAQELFSIYTEKTSHPGVATTTIGSKRKDSIGRSPTSLQNDKVGLDPDLRGVVYNLVAEDGGVKEFETLVKMYKEEDNQQEKVRLGRALGQFKNKALLKKALEFGISKHVRFQDSLGFVASVWSNPEGRYLAWGFVKKNWKLLKERYAGGHYFTRVFGPAGDFTKASDIKDIETFVKKNSVPEARRTIAQALEQIESNVEWLKRDKKGIEEFLKLTS